MKKYLVKVTRVAEVEISASGKIDASDQVANMLIDIEDMEDAWDDQFEVEELKPFKITFESTRRWESLVSASDQKAAEQKLKTSARTRVPGFDSELILFVEEVTE